MYHDFVFDEEKRTFLGHFEEMYQAEGKNGFDSWHQESDIHLTKPISQSLLGRYNFDKVLDIGCGKGTFTAALKKENNYVLGVDVSATAIRKAKAKYPHCDFAVMPASTIKSLGRFNLIVIMETLSYLEDWQQLLTDVSKMTEWLYISLYIPDRPIGYVKSHESLVTTIAKHFLTKTEITIDKRTFCILASIRHEHTTD